MFLGGEEFLDKIYHEEKSYKFGYIKVKSFGISEDIIFKVRKDKVQDGRRYMDPKHIKKVYELKGKGTNPMEKWEKIQTSNTQKEKN